MKNILLLGAGHVTRPLVQYLLNQPNFYLIIATRTLSKTGELLQNHPRGKAYPFDIESEREKLNDLVSKVDLVISLLPYVYHSEVAKFCIKFKKPMITTSYVGDEMAKLDKDARDAGIIILNEIGLDPGIDHMAAMEIIDEVKERGGKITHFYSYCGGLPAPEANTNPWGYKFSWSPKGVVMAAKRDAQYLKDGKEVKVPWKALFSNYFTLTIEELGEFEVYPNGNSLPYIQKYSIPEVKTMFRGTIRNKGWCNTWANIGKIGLLSDEKREIAGFTYREFIGELVQVSKKENIKKEVAQYLGLSEDSLPIKNFEWLGLFSDEKLPLDYGSPMDILTEKLVQKLKYEEGERDMIILNHKLIAEYAEKKEEITATLVDFGKPGGDTAMARTVSLPAAIAAKLILLDKIPLTGVQIPVEPSIYKPVLKELENQGITFKEKRKEIGCKRK